MANNSPQRQEPGDTPEAREATSDLVEMCRGLEASALGMLEDSQANIAEVIREALEAKGMSIYELHERSGVDLGIVQDLADGDYDLSDSEPITRVEAVLGVHLRHL